jgi:phosphoribosylamine-glycine ligase
MKFLVISKYHNGLALAKRLLDEGNEVYLFNGNHLYNGIVNKVKTIDEGISKNPDIAIFTTSNLDYTKVIQAGIKIFGAGPLENKLENDKLFANKFAAAYGIRVPKYREFYNVESATKHLQLTKDKYIIRRMNDKFISQKFINGICEINLEIWFCNGQPIYQYNGSMEQDQFLAGDLGNYIGTQSCLLWGYQSKNIQIVNDIFKDGLFDILKKNDYTGILNVHCIINENDHYPYFLKFNTSFRYPAIYNLLEIMKGEFGKLINDIVNNQNPKIELKENMSVSMAISVPPYPYAVNGISVNKQEIIFNKEDREHIWFHDIYDNDLLKIAGLSGLIGYITASDTSWKTARLKMAKIMRSMNIDNIQYRVDAGVQGNNLYQLTRLEYI